MSSYLDAPLIDEPSAPTVQDNPVGFLDNLFYGGQMADVGQQINQGLIPTGVPDQPQPKWMEAPLYDPEAEAQAKQQHLEDVRNQLATQDELAGKNLPQDQEKLNLYERAGLGFGQGLAGLGEAAGGAIEATQRLIAGKPPSGEYGNVGASLSRYSKAKSAELQDYGDLNPSLAGSVVQHLTAGITGMLPLVVGGAVAGVPAAMVTAGVQGFGSTYNKAKDSFEASGSSPDEAANGAYFPAILGGALSAVLMGNYFGKTGAEALRAGLTADTAKSLALAAMKHVGIGAGITGVQAIGDGLIEKATYNPNKSIGEIAQEAVLAAAEGGALGGIMAGVPALARRTIPAVARAADRGLSRFAQTVDERMPFAGPAYDPNIQPDARKVSVPWLPDPNQPDTAIINQPPVMQEQAPVLPAQPATSAFQLQPKEPNATQEGNVQSDTGIQRAQTEVAQPADQAGLRTGVQVPQEIPQEPVVFTPDQAQQLRSVIAPSMQGRAMEVPPSDLTDPNNAHLRHYLKQIPDAPKNATWTDLAQTGLITLTPNEHGLIEIRYAPEQSPVPETEQAKGGELQNGQKIQTQETVQQGRQKAGENVGQELLNSTPVVPAQVQPEPSTIKPDLTVPPVVKESLSTEPTLARKKSKTDRVAKGETKGSAFARETALLPEGEDIISWIRGNAPMMSKTAFLKKNPGAKTASWDGASRLSNPSHTMAIYGDGKFTPDVVAQAAFDAHLIKEPSEAALWDAINQASELRTNIRKGQGGEKAMLEQLASEHEDWLKATAKGEKRISADDLKIGDSMEVAGEKVKVTEIDSDTNDVTLEDGKKFGKQTLTSGNSIHVEKLTEAPVSGDFAPPEPVKQVMPKLAPGEKGTGDLLKNQTEDFALAGEKGVDYARIQAEKEAAIKKAAEAKAAQDKAQLDMFGKQGSLRTGQEPVPPGPARTATGRVAVKALVNDPTSGVPRRTVNVINALLDEPALRDSALADKLTVTVGDAGKNFAATVEGNDIIIKPDIAPADFAQEIGHILTRSLPKEYLDKIESDRQQALRDKFGENIPPEFQAGMTNAEFLNGIEAGRPEFTQETYPLSNFSEFLGTWFGEKYANEHFQNRNQGDLTVWQRVRKWFTGIADALGRVFGRTPTMERMYREMLAGTHKTNPQEGALFEAKQGAFVKDKEEAQKSLARYAGDRSMLDAQRESIHASVTPLADIVTRGLPADASKRAQREVGVFDLAGIRATLGNVPSETYQQIKARHVGSDFVKQLGFETGARISVLNKKWNDVLAEHAKAEERINSPVFQRRLTHVNDLEVESNAMFTLAKNFESRMKDEVAAAQKIVQSEAGNAGAGAAILAQAQRGLDSLSAVRQAIHDQMEVLASDPAKLFALFQHDPNAQQLFQDYMQRKAAMYAAGTTNPPFDPVIVKWASETLAADNANLRKLVLAQMLRDNLDFRKQFTAEEKKIASGLRDNPAATMRDLLKEERKNVTGEITALEAFKTLNTEVMTEVQNHKDLTEAKGIIDRVRSNPDYVTLRNESAKDGGLQVRPDGKVEAIVNGHKKEVNLADMDYDATQLIHLEQRPDGSLVQVDMGAENFAPERAKLESLQNDWMNWVEAQDQIAPELRDPNYDYFKQKMNRINNVLLTSEVNQPTRLTKPWVPGHEAPSFHIVESTAEALGTRGGALVKKSGAVFVRTSFLASNYSRHYLHQLSESAFKAARSMGFVTKQRGLNEAAVFLGENVLNPLFALGQHAGAKIHVGMVVGEGYKITKEVLDHYRLQVKMASEGYGIIQKEVPKDYPDLASTPVLKTMIDGAEIFGSSIKNTPWTLPSSGFTQRGSDFVRAYQAATPAEAKSLLENNWPMIFNYLQDRSSVMAFGPSPHENAYHDVAQEIQNLKLQGKLVESMKNLDWVADRVSSITGQPVADVKAGITKELTDLIGLMGSKLNEPDLTHTAASVDRANSTTRRRSQIHELPSYFVNYGWNTSRDFMGFVFDLHSYSFAKYAEALNTAHLELLRQRAQLVNEIELKAAQQGISKEKARSAIIEQNKRDVLNGNAYRQLDALDDKISMLASNLAGVQEVFTKGANSVDLETLPGKRFATMISGGATSAVGSTINNGMVTALLGGQVKNYTNNAVMTVVKTFLNWMDHGWVRNLSAYAASGLKAVSQIPGGLARGVKEFKAGQGPGAALGEAFREPLEELMNGSNRRIRNYRTMLAAGMVPVENIGAEFKAKMMSPTTGGLILDSHQTALDKTGAAIGTVIESTLLNPIVKAVLPRLGDVVTNSTTFKTGQQILGKIEDQLRVIFLNQKNWGNTGRFDTTNWRNLKNDLSSGELFTGMPGPEAIRRLEQTKSFFERGGLSFQTIAKDFIGELHKGNKNARFGTEEQRNRMIGQLMFDTNIPNVINRPYDFKKQTLGWKILAALQGFNVFGLDKYFTMAARATNPGTSRKLAWAMIGLLTIPAIMAINSATDTTAEQLKRWAYKYLLGTERATRQPWEQDGAKRQAIGWLLSAVNPIPFVGMIANNVGGNDMPSRASFDLTPVVINKTKDIFKYLGGVVQTGDPTYGAADLVRSVFPWMAGIVNRLPEQEGLVELNNAARLLRRYGPTDLLKPGGPSIAVPATEITPLIRAMENAMGRGDIQEFTRLKDAAEAKAIELGKDPNTVKASFEARNPYSKVFTGKLTDDQRQAILDRMSDSERKTLTDAEQKFSEAHDTFGTGKEKTFTVSQEQADKRQAKREDRISNFQSGMPNTVLPVSSGNRNPGTSSSSGALGRVAGLGRQPSSSIAGLSRLSGKVRKVRLAPIKTGRSIVKSRSGLSRARKTGRGLRRR